ncbi:MAG: BRO family protein [Lachnospiraceae bacterium]|nr:BRO family protein [Lachnospiraceae bacterium]
MNMIKKAFEQTGIGKLRTVIIEGEPWFLGLDVGACLGYAIPRKAYFDHTEEKYRKALYYKDSSDLVLSELLNTSAKKCYNILTKKDFLREKLIVIDPLR